MVELNLSDLSEEAQVDAKIAAGEIIVEEINNHLDRSESPVEGGAFQREKADGKPSTLFEDGDLRAAITFEEYSDGIIVGVFDDQEDVERKKAYNHNVGDTLPERRFIPEERGEFRQSIMDRVNAEIELIRMDDKANQEEPLDSIDSFLSDDFLDNLLMDILNG